MFDQIWNQLSSSMNNQFLSGGLVLGTIAWAATFGRSLPGKVWNYTLRYYTVTADILSDEQAYRWMMKWLHAQPYMRTARRLSIINYKDDVLLVPAHGNHLFWWNKKLLWLERGKENQQGSGMGGAGNSPVASSSGGGFLPPKDQIKIRVLGRKQEIILKILAEAKEQYETISKDTISVYTNRGYDGYVHENRKPRALSTVFLPPDAKGLLPDIKEFLGSEEWYRHRGIPFRRGYLLYGPPGGGKSSVAEALAGELKLNLYVINMSGMSGDQAVERAFHRVDTDQPALILLEDIDTAVPSDREVNKDKNHYSLGTVLNCLDGLNAKTNCVLIMTTNHRDVIDPALIRPGRCDRQIEFPNATPGQIQEAVNLYFPDCPDMHRVASQWQHPISMAQVQENLRALSPR